VVLVDGGTFSAASNFTASLRAQRRITVIGQETGGAEAGCNGGTISDLELPETHLVLQLPHFQMLTACPSPQLGRGVCPDIEVVPTPRQVATRTDAVLNQLPALLR
jgi:C-terminal processing protease CtpA/Prc